ncbi:hypothetical protein [Amphibacillus cookii]|uniref:hypothetical protein n=1 Tax=Amphibacillus cookii TaxID=767787 RepID=UPI001958657C|nr:hypothetical protein [Amphibacillus cookii]MBM7541818.1 cytochrome c oxidase subunit 4 [Amphibacillus cookii]
MIGWLNIGSFVLGLVAWILPIVNLTRYMKPINNNWMLFSMLSMSACAISLFFQLLNDYNRVKVEDWSALMDIMGGRASIAAILLIGTISLNIITLIVYQRKLKK